MPKKSRQNLNILKKKKAFRMKNIFHHFLRAIIEANQKKDLEGESPTLKFTNIPSWTEESIDWNSSSLLHLIRAIARAHASTRANSLMRVKNSTRHSFYDIHCLRYWNKENERKNKNIKFNSWSFSLIFGKLSLAWMLYFGVWLQNKGKFLVWSEYYNQFAIYINLSMYSC